MTRESVRTSIESTPRFDLCVIGGGATGIGIAVDAAARGHSVVLVEQDDFGKGTSSRSTKLVHGGVRYLQQGNVALVMEALRERGILRRNAPHLVHDLGFVVPNYAWWEGPFYGIGLRIYDLLAGRYGFGPSRHLSREQVLAAIPTLEQNGLRGGVIYHDGQFDDARLLIALARTAQTQGALLLDHARVVRLLGDATGMVDGVVALDGESGDELAIRARCTINATGAFADGVRRLDDATCRPLVTPSQGIHVVLDRSFLPGDCAIMVPRTSDRRVLFAIPWHDRTLVGTTDTPVEHASLEPRAFDHEIDFVLGTAARYLTRDPSRADVLSVFAGIRPLAAADDGGDTAALSRDHSIHVSRRGLLTIVGGKWTTYRKMAEDVVDHAQLLAGLPEHACTTRELRVHGWCENAATLGDLADWGSDAAAILALERADPALATRLHDRLPYRRSQVVFAVREEFARTVEDVLARRLRALFLDARAASDIAPAVAAIVATELGREANWIEAQVASFRALAADYLVG
ncbi:MAG: glycerol-3-phosphate dehydrogenase/oxidase [Planctomycetes bacterium]|nr:glycerol-3-phosphate dehydrogenase/oxidase [Planctomycetota bacterium]